MISCTCADEMSICKHMYVGQRVLNKLVTYERNFQNERHLTLKDILRMKEDKELDKKREAFQIWQQEAESLVNLVRERWGASSDPSEKSNDTAQERLLAPAPAAEDDDKEKEKESTKEEDQQPANKKRKLSSGQAEDAAVTAAAVTASQAKSNEAVDKRAALESFRQQAEMLGNLARGQKIDDIVQTWGLQQINAIIGDLRKMKQMLGAL